MVPKGRRPQASRETLRGQQVQRPEFNKATPKFCLNYLRSGFDVHALSHQRQAAFAKTLQKLAASTWQELTLAPRHGQGKEFIPVGKVKAPIPERFQDNERFTVFRYDGKLPMAGVRVDDVFHVLWIEPEFGRLYDHD